MEVLLRVIAVLLRVLCFLLEPFYWLRTLMKTTIPLQTIRNPILTMSAAQLAEKIRTGEIKCEEVIETYSFRSRRLDMKLNAIVDERYEEALREAERVDELVASGSKTRDQLREETPLLGVPVSISSCFRVKGLSHTTGCERSDGAAVAGLCRAGAIPLVSTNTPELCVPGETYNLVSGLTNNPYNYHRTVGGPAGGEASLIAGAGLVVGVGCERFGSVCGPAMYCGVFAHRPTPGTVGEAAGVLARYAEDLPLMLGAMAGEKAGALGLTKPVPVTSIQVFFMTEAGFSLGLPSVDREIKLAIVKAVDHLRKDCNCQVEKVSFEEMSNCLEISRTVLYTTRDLPDVLEEDNSINTKECSNIMNTVARMANTFMTHTLSALYFNLVKRTRGFISRKKIHRYIIEKEELRKKLIERLSDSGVLIMPTQPTAAHYHHQWLLRPSQGVYCDIVTALDLPATNVPMGLNSKGLPIGLQVVGAPYQDRLCLAVAQQLEREFGGWVQPPCLKPPSETRAQ